MAKPKRKKAKSSAKRPGKQLPRSETAVIPPGATRAALDRPLDPGGGKPGSGAGPRHAAGDPGDDNESAGRSDTSQVLGEAPAGDEDELEAGPPYAGPSGGAVGGTPAQVRSRGGRTHRGISPRGIHRGDSTIGTDPHSGAE